SLAAVLLLAGQGADPFRSQHPHAVGFQGVFVTLALVIRPSTQASNRFCCTAWTSCSRTESIGGGTASRVSVRRITCQATSVRSGVFECSPFFRSRRATWKLAGMPEGVDHCRSPPSALVALSSECWRARAAKLAPLLSWS